MRWRQTWADPALAASLVVGFLVLAVAGRAPASPQLSSAEARYRALEELPTRASSVDAIEDTAKRLVAELGTLPASINSSEPCPLLRMAVSWTEPEGYQVGSHISPVGPAPGPGDTDANGVVVCEGSTYAYVGFESHRLDDGSWRITTVPDVPSELALGSLDASLLPGREPPAGDPTTLTSVPYFDLLDLGPIDPYAPYQPQRVCDPTPKPGAVALARLLLDEYPSTDNFGISRACDLGPTSEHKEGRAFDWGARVDDATQRAAVRQLIGRLLATDAQGNPHALARRLGVMYIIWNRHIWASYRAQDGWRPYHGPSAHTDHVHLSLSWDGAAGRTSIWRSVLPDGGRWWLAGPALEGDLPVLALLLPEDAGSSTGGGDRGGAAGSGDGAGGTGDGTDGTTDGGGTSDQPDDGSSVLDPVQDAVDDVTDQVPGGDQLDDVVDDVTDTVDDVTDEVTDTIDDTVDEVTGVVPTPTPSPSPTPSLQDLFGS